MSVNAYMLRLAETDLGEKAKIFPVRDEESGRLAGWLTPSEVEQAANQTPPPSNRLAQVDLDATIAMFKSKS
jgi:hypothetical protein